MTIKTIAYEQLFPTGVYANQRLRVEISLDGKDFEACYNWTNKEIEPPTPDSVIHNAFEQAKRLVNDAFEKMNPQIKWSEQSENHTIVQVEEDKPELTPEDGLIEIIDQCRTIQLLERQRKQVERMNSPRVNEAFENKLKSLQG